MAYYNIADYNTAYGYQALVSNTSGFLNTTNGHQALLAILAVTSTRASVFMHFMTTSPATTRRPSATTRWREPAATATLQPGNYTAIVRGVNTTTGVGLVEVYDFD